MNRGHSTNERSVALFLLGVLLIFPPILQVFNRVDLIFGVPILYLYIFASWALLIAIASLISRRIAHDRLEESARDPLARESVNPAKN